MSRRSLAQQFTDVVGVVLRDVHDTTPVRLTVTVLDDAAERRLMAALHERGAEPDPEYRIETLARSVRVSWRLDAEPTWSETRADLLTETARHAQTLTQVRLWELGLDPTWPPCPDHGGAHPLDPRQRYAQVDPRRHAGGDVVSWGCRQDVVRGDSVEVGWGPVDIPVGRLDGVSGGR